MTKINFLCSPARNLIGSTFGEGLVPVLAKDWFHGLPPTGHFRILTAELIRKTAPLIEINESLSFAAMFFGHAPERI